MHNNRQTRIENLIEQALELPSEDRTLFIKKKCGTDNKLRLEIDSLLLHEEEAFTFIQNFSKNIVRPTLFELSDTVSDEYRRIDSIVGHYQITDVLGTGGMGVVYKAKDINLDRTVALKFLPSHLTRSGKDRQRFILEAKSAAALNHPNICTIHSVEEYGGQYFISMEFIEGQTLRKKIESKEGSLSSTLEYSIQLADALREAHEKDIIHLDIKPANIMLDARNRIKVMDFGLAKLLDESNLIRERIMGTMPYMSPEQANADEIDHRTDIWSMGVVLYEMIAGKRPFRGESNLAIIHSILHKKPEPLAKIETGVPEQLNKIVLKCLEKNADDRYQSMDEIIIDLHQVRIDLLKAQENKKSLFPKHHTRRNVIGGLTALVVLLLVGYWLLPLPGTGPSTDAAIAVLPLESISQNPDDIEFTNGVHEELINRLAGIGGLTVIARSSVLGYPPKERDLQTVGRELGVSTILEGTIRRFNDQVRVAVQLIDIKTQNTIWSGSFDESMDDLFEMQSRIARQVAGELHAALTEEEQQRLVERPTDNQQAYLFYIQGRQYIGQPYWEKENLLAAEQFFNKAKNEDPQFAQAWAMLAYTYAWLYLYYETTPEQLEKARKAAEQAQYLDSNLPETQLALGIYHYSSAAGTEQALSHFESALRQSPNNPTLHLMTSKIHRRIGNWKLVFHHLEKALEQDPLNENLYAELTWNYDIVRDFDKVLEYDMKMKELFPNELSDFWISYTRFRKDGNLQAHEVFAENYSVDPAAEMPHIWGDYNMLKHDWKEALRAYNNIPNEQNSKSTYNQRGYKIANAFYAQGSMAEARIYFEKAKNQLERLHERYPDQPQFQMELAKVNARLGEAEKAVRMGEEVMKQPIIQNARYEDAVQFTAGMAVVYTWSGHEEQAIDNLGYLLSIPTPVDRTELKRNPIWDPLRDNPRFQELIAGEDKPYIEGL